MVPKKLLDKFKTPLDMQRKVWMVPDGHMEGIKLFYVPKNNYIINQSHHWTCKGMCGWCLMGNAAFRSSDLCCHDVDMAAS
jgi:hypothetical protein